MRRLLATVLVTLLCSRGLCAQMLEDPEETRALELLEQLGGKSQRAVVAVSFRFCKNVTYADVEKIIGPLHAHLERVDLSHTPLGDKDLDGLRLGSGLFQQLTELDLSGTRITDAGMAHLARLSNLRKLDLSQTAITGSDFFELRNLTNLTELNLSETKLNFRGLKSLKVLSSLKKLELSATDIDGTALAQLAELVNLTELDLYGTKIRDGSLDYLRPLTRLRTLEASRTLINDFSVSCLASMPKIQSVLIHHTRVTPSGLLKLVEMRKHGYLRILQYLFVDSSQLTPEVRAALEKTFPDIHVQVVDDQ